MTAVGEKHVPIASAIRGLAHKISFWLPGINGSNYFSKK
jgi:hypothetical protein